MYFRGSALLRMQNSIFIIGWLPNRQTLNSYLGFCLNFPSSFSTQTPSNPCFEVFKTRLVSGWRCVVEPPVKSCWDLPVLQQECRRAHVNADHLSFVEGGRLFFLHLIQYMCKGILEHLHAKKQSSPENWWECSWRGEEEDLMRIVSCTLPSPSLRRCWCELLAWKLTTFFWDQPAQQSWPDQNLQSFTLLLPGKRVQSPNTKTTCS